MKITINIDCSAEEARQFLGLPDVRPLQEAMMAELRERLSANMKSMDPDALMRQWMPAGFAGMDQPGFPGMDQLQKSFWGAMVAAAGRKGEEQSS